MRCRSFVVVVVVVVVVVGLASAGCLEPPAPPVGVVVCIGADDCPGGFSCDLEAHECRADGDAAPAILEVVVAPAVIATGVALLTIRSDVALDPDAVPDVEFVAGSPPLRLASSASREPRPA